MSNRDVADSTEPGDADFGPTGPPGATFADARFRAELRKVGRRVAGSFDLGEVECDESVVERRIERRDGVSDADFEVHLHFRDVFDRIETDHVIVDNSGDETKTFAQVDAAFGGASEGGEEFERPPSVLAIRTTNAHTRLPSLIPTNALLSV